MLWAYPLAGTEALAAIYGYSFWRLTVRPHFISYPIRWFFNGFWAWITFKPGSRTWRMARNLALALIRLVVTWAFLARFLRSQLERFPMLKKYQRQILANIFAPAIRSEPAPVGPFSERDRFVLARLTAALQKRAN
jgi:hypothetical protein